MSVSLFERRITLLLLHPSGGVQDSLGKCKKDILYKNFNWDDLLVEHKYKHSIIEYIDSDEQNNSLICMLEYHLH